MSDWKHKDEWRKFGKDFLVTVTRHSVEVSPEFDHGDGPNRWAVYAYVYPRHPYFEKFDRAGQMSQEACSSMPLHAYPSFFHVHVDAKTAEITSFQVGADYQHLHDDFTHSATEEEAWSIFHDANHLYAWLTERAAP